MQLKTQKKKKKQNYKIEEFVIIHKKDLIELQKSKHVLKDLLGTIENLNNKLKQICDDIRTISES